MKKGLAIGGLILVTVIWGGGFVASDMALESMKPFQIMMVRFLLASVLMGLVSLGQRNRKEEVVNRTGAIKAGILMGVALFIGFSLQIIALQYTTPSKNAFLTAIYSICYSKKEDRCEGNYRSYIVSNWSCTSFAKRQSYAWFRRCTHVDLCNRVCISDFLYE
mgnify:CR=1 FL=1